jgi:transcriptional regulator of acetoin/glycerol metabolism
METILELPWAGNTRQLRTALQYALILCDDAAIEIAHLPHDPASAIAPGLRAPSTVATDVARPAPEPAPVRTLVEREVEQLQSAVDRARGNLSRAAAELGIARSTLYRRLRRHGLVS